MNDALKKQTAGPKIPGGLVTKGNAAPGFEMVRGASGNLTSL